MILGKLLLVLMAVCLQVEDITGRDDKLHKKQNKRLSNLETATIKMQNELTKITSRLDDFQEVTTEMSEVKLRLDEFLNTIVQRPTYDEELVKSLISEVMSKTLDTIQDGLVNEKEQRIRFEYMALETKDLIKNQNELFQKKTGLLENRTEENKDLINNQNELFQKKSELLENRIEACLTGFKAKDCWELKEIYGISDDGVYDVVSPDSQKISLRCDMTTDGGGWTIVQRRGDGSVRFNNTYTEYESFFGNLTGEFWMGNDFLNVFTRGVKQTLRVDICDWDNEEKWAKYKHFSVGPSADKYRLAVDNYSGTAGDPLIRGYEGDSGRSHNGEAFSAPGADHDNWAGGDCASWLQSGWWFNRCHSANLNGLYQPETSSDRTAYGIQWWTWIPTHSFKGSEMKIRPSTSSTSSSNKPFNCPVI